MARRLNIGFNQGPATLSAQTIKYSLMMAQAGFAAGTTPGPPIVQRFLPGHYIAIRPSQITGAGLPNCGTYSPSTGVVTGGLASNAGPACMSSADGKSGNLLTPVFVVRFNWNAIETTAGNFDYSLPDKYLAQAANLGVALEMLIIERTFDGLTAPGGANPPTNPMPADIASFADVFTTGSSGNQRWGYQGWRWSPTVRSRFDNLCKKLGARYDTNVFFAGIATQETSTGNATGGSAGTYTVGTYTGSDNYTLAGFIQGLDDESDSIENWCPHTKPFHYQNFINNGGATDLRTYATHVQPNGAWFGGPDLVTGVSGNANIVNNCYPNYTLYHNGTSPIPGKGPTFCSAQSGEFNGTGVGDSPANMANLFNYGTSSFTCKPANGFSGALDWTSGSPLNLDAIVWDYEPRSTGQNYTASIVPIMKLKPTFGTFSP